MHFRLSNSAVKTFRIDGTKEMMLEIIIKFLYCFFSSTQGGEITFYGLTETYISNRIMIFQCKILIRI